MVAAATGAAVLLLRLCWTSLVLSWTPPLPQTRFASRVSTLTNGLWYQQQQHHPNIGPASRRTTIPTQQQQQQQQQQRRLSATASSSHAALPTTVNGDDSPSKNHNNNSKNNNNSNAPSNNNNIKIRLDVNEKARTVTSVCTSGTLCTLSSPSGSGGGPLSSEDMQGAPFGSFVDYVLDDDGNPVFLMNEMSMHTINIRSDPRVTLFTQLEHQTTTTTTTLSNRPQRSSGSGSGAGQDVSRCSLTGVVHKIVPSEAADWDTLRMRYSLTHTYADQVMDSPKFAFYRLIPTKIYFVGGFGVLAKWIAPDEYRRAAPDILATAAPEICAKLNRDHVEDLLLTARHLVLTDNANNNNNNNIANGGEVNNNNKNNAMTELVSLRVTNVDRLGLDLRITAQQKSRRNKLQTDEFRIGFRIPVQSVEDAKSEILKIFQEAWEKAHGVDWGEEEEETINDDDNDESGVATTAATVPILKIAADSLE